MRYPLADIPDLLRTPVGRSQFWFGVRQHLWPLYSLASRLQLRTATRGTRITAVVGSFGKTTAVRACMAALGIDPSGARGQNSWSGLASEAMIDAGRSPRAAAEAIRSVLEPGDGVLIKGRDTQRLERVGLRLLGRDVGCDIPFCDATLRCAACPMLRRSWGGHRVVI